MSSSPRAGPSTEYPNNAYDQHNESPESPVSDQDAQDSVIRLLENLSKRGKGQYYCPYGAGCRKGGLHRDGTPAVFERNSTFKLVRQLSNQTEPKTNMHRNRTHLQKHLKVYKCDIPGCRNKSGFARSDQLTRHKETVQHYPIILETEHLSMLIIRELQYLASAASPFKC
jgi:hypothetical protein